MAPKRPESAGAIPKPVESPALSLPDQMPLYAALDLGTNSCRMLIAQPKGNQFKVVDSFSSKSSSVTASSRCALSRPRPAVAQPMAPIS